VNFSVFLFRPLQSRNCLDHREAVDPWRHMTLTSWLAWEQS